MRIVSMARPAGRILAFAAMLTYATNVNAQSGNPRLAALAQDSTAAPIVVVAGAEHYTAAPAPFPNGAMIAVLSGDPTKTGAPYTIRIKLPDGARIPPHTHGGVENVTVMQGSFLVGLGSTFDASKMNALPVGSYVSVPPGLPHYAMAKGVTVVDVSGIGPESTNAVK
jgi:quercetin dioxygenase-like cupin family protein